MKTEPILYSNFKIGSIFFSTRWVFKSQTWTNSSGFRGSSLAKICWWDLIWDTVTTTLSRRQLFTARLELARIVILHPLERYY